MKHFPELKGNMQQMQTYLSNGSTCFDFSSKINALERLSNESTSMNNSQDLQRARRPAARQTYKPTKLL